MLNNNNTLAALLIYLWGKNNPYTVLLLGIVVVPLTFFVGSTWGEPWGVTYSLFIIASGYAMASVATMMLRIETIDENLQGVVVVLIAYFGLWMGYFLFLFSGISVKEAPWKETYFSLVLMRSFVGCYIIAITRRLWLPILGFRNIQWK